MNMDPTPVSNGHAPSLSSSGGALKTLEQFIIEREVEALAARVTGHLEQMRVRVDG